MVSVGLVIAQFYETMAEEMEEQAHERISERDAEIIQQSTSRESTIVHLPLIVSQGAMELTLWQC